MSFATALVACTGWEEIDFPGPSNDGMLFAHADASVRSCPAIHYYTVSPLQTSVGGTLSLRVSASSSTETVTIRWSGTGGTVKDPSAFETTYECAEAGPQKIEINVLGNGCVRSEHVDIVCVNE
jgi:hypothetical protein